MKDCYYKTLRKVLNDLFFKAKAPLIEIRNEILDEEDNSMEAFELHDIKKIDHILDLIEEVEMEFYKFEWDSRTKR